MMTNTSTNQALNMPLLATSLTNQDAPLLFATVVPATGDSAKGASAKGASANGTKLPTELSKLPTELSKLPTIATAAPSRGVRYTTVSAGPHVSYFTRSDGTVDRSYGSGRISSTHAPAAPGIKYIDASAGQFASYYLRDDGAVDRTTSHGAVSVQMNPPPGHRFTAVESGFHASYLLCSDGSVSRTKGKGVVTAVMRPSDSRGDGDDARYIGVSAGTFFAYLLRSDGTVDRCRGGKVLANMAPDNSSGAITGRSGPFLLGYRGGGFVPCKGGKGGKGGKGDKNGNGVRYVGVTACEACVYLVRSDGQVDRSRGRARVHTTMAPPLGTRYTSVSRGFALASSKEQQSPPYSYLVRDDGALDRTWGSGKVQREPLRAGGEGGRYVEASAGSRTSYFLTAEGGVARTTYSGRIDGVTFPAP